MSTNIPGTAPTPTPNPTDATSTGSLGDGGVAALAAEREARKTAETELKKYKDAATKAADAELTETQRLTKELADEKALTAKTNLENAKYKVGVEVGLPKEFIARLQGTDEASLRTDAEALLKLVGPTPKKVPKADPSQGKKTDSSGLSNSEQFESTIDSMFDNQ